MGKPSGSCRSNPKRSLIGSRLAGLSSTARSSRWSIASSLAGPRVVVTAGSGNLHKRQRTLNLRISELWERWLRRDRQTFVVGNVLTAEDDRCEAASGVVIATEHDATLPLAGGVVNAAKDAGKETASVTEYAAADTGRKDIGGIALAAADAAKGAAGLVKLSAADAGNKAACDVT